MLWSSVTKSQPKWTPMWDFVRPHSPHHHKTLKWENICWNDLLSVSPVELRDSENLWQKEKISAWCNNTLLRHCMLALHEIVTHPIQLLLHDMLCVYGILERILLYYHQALSNNKPPAVKDATLYPHSKWDGSERNKTEKNPTTKCHRVKPLVILL